MAIPYTGIFIVYNNNNNIAAIILLPLAVSHGLVAVKYTRSSTYCDR
jgi:hypothetical protein